MENQNPTSPQNPSPQTATPLPTQSWNQDDPTIQKIRKDYNATFGKGTIGISSNEMVVSYELNGGKIVGIYLSATYKIMVQ